MLLLEKVLHAKNTKLYEGKLFSFFVTLGICSYSLYLLHQPYLGSFIEKLWIVENVGFGIAALVGTFFFLFIVSYASYRIVELPSIRYGKKIYNIFQQKKNRLQVQPNN
jgi:peptidoglycan/LPS O-acetylase OafA/YrhL